MPLSWAELKKMTVRPQFDVVGFAEWKTRLKKDPWKEMESLKQRINL